MKTPLIHLVTRHYDVIEQVFRFAQVHPLVVEAIVAGVAVEQEVFDRVLTALNEIAGTKYTQDDFTDVHILAPTDLRTTNTEEELTQYLFL